MFIIITMNMLLNFIIFKDLFIFMCMCVYIHQFMYTTCGQMPTEASGPRELELQAVVR